MTFAKRTFGTGVSAGIAEYPGRRFSNSRYRFAGCAFVLAMFAPLVAPRANAQSLDPAGSGPIVAALGWIRDTLLGNIATTVAVIAVATIGLLMLTGRLNWRFGATVIVGCFILFGAATIVSGIRAAAG